ncbi:MAG: putative autotransporter protein, partial [Acidobacteriaceae bacterium]|nr:putative autotransporter protein [Acidobacteriaceae bacterium]
MLNRTNRGWWRGVLLLAGLLVLVTSPGVALQTTTVQDRVYRADGTPAQGTVLLSWPAFTAADGTAVAAGNQTLTIGAGGALSIALTANAGATPAGSYYTAVYHLNDGTVQKEYWVVPQAGPTTLSAIRANVVPAAVAQTWSSQATINAALSSMQTSFLPLKGGAVSGPITLPGDPSAGLQAATKQYVDSRTSLPANAIPYQGSNGSGVVAATFDKIVAPFHSTVYVSNTVTYFSTAFNEGAAGSGLIGTRPATDVPGSSWIGSSGSTTGGGVFVSGGGAQFGPANAGAPTITLLDTGKADFTWTLSSVHLSGSASGGFQIYARANNPLSAAEVIQWSPGGMVAIQDATGSGSPAIVASAQTSGLSGDIVVTLHGQAITVNWFGTVISGTIPTTTNSGNTFLGFNPNGSLGNTNDWAMTVSSMTVSLSGPMPSMVACNGIVHSDGSCGTVAPNQGIATDANGHATHLPEVQYSTDSAGNTTIACQEDHDRGIFDPRCSRTEKIDGNNTVVTIYTSPALALQETANEANCWVAKNHRAATINLPPGNFKVGLPTEQTLTFGPGQHILGSPSGTVGVGGASNEGGTIFNATYTNAYVVQVISPYTSICGDGTTATNGMDGGDVENLQAVGCSEGGCINAPGDTNTYGGGGPGQGGIYVLLGHGVGRNLRAAFTGGVGVNANGLDSEFWDMWSYSALGYYRYDRSPINPAAAPGTVTPAAFTTGGTLAAGTYYYVVTAVTTGTAVKGETTGSPETIAVTTKGTGSIALNWAPVNNATGYKVYRGTASGAELVYYTTSTNSFTDTGTAGTAGAVPTSNTSGSYDPTTDLIHGGVEADALDGRFHHIETYGSFTAPGSSGSGASEYGHVCGVVVNGGNSTVDDIFEQIDEMGVCKPYGGSRVRISNIRAEGNAGPSLFNQDSDTLVTQGVLTQGCTVQAVVTQQGFCDDLEDTSAGGGTYVNVKIRDDPHALGTSYRTGFISPGKASFYGVDQANGDGFDKTFPGANGDQIGIYTQVPETDPALPQGGTTLTGSTPDVGALHRIQMQNGSPTNITDVTNPTIGQAMHITLASVNDVLVAKANGGAWQTCTGQNIAGPAGPMTFWVFDHGQHRTIAEECDALPASQVANAADKSSTSAQAFNGQITAPQIGTVYQVDGFPSSCTVGGTAYTTKADCAFYTAKADAIAHNSVPLVQFGVGKYPTCAGLDMGNATAYAVSLKGVGATAQGGHFANSTTTLQASCAMTNVINHGDVSTTSNYYQLANLSISDLTVDANNLAQHCWDIDGLAMATFKNLTCGFATGTDFYARFGDPFPAGGFLGGDNNIYTDNLYIVGGGHGVPQWAQVTASQTGGVPNFAVASGGSYINSISKAYLYGYGAGAFPCTRMGTLTVTMSGSTVSAVSGSGFSGCTGTMYVVIPDIPPAQYGLIVTASDSTLKDLDVFNIGQTAGLQANGGNTHYIHLHTLSQPVGVIDNGGSTFDALEIDSPVHYGMQIQSATTVVSSKSYWNASWPASGDFFIGNNSSGAQLLNHTCGNNQTAGGYAEITSPNGQFLGVAPTANQPVAWPAGVIAVNAQECGGGHQSLNYRTGAQRIYGSLNLIPLGFPIISSVVPNTTGTSTVTYEV